MRKDKIVGSLLTLLIFFAVIGLVQAQGAPFAIGGWILDHEGNPVSGVSINITNLETGSTIPTVISSAEPEHKGKWVADLGNLRPDYTHAEGDRIQIVATAPDGRTNTTVVLRAAVAPQIVNITLPPLDTKEPIVKNPSANPSSIVANGIQTSRLNVTVTDPEPSSGIKSVTVDLSALGGPSAKEMTKIAGTNIYTTTTTAAKGTPPGTYHLTVNATDKAGNFNNTVNITLVVEAPKAEITEFTVTPATQSRGKTFTASITVNSTEATAKWYKLIVSGVDNGTGYPLAGTGVIRLGAEEEEQTAPVLVYVPFGASPTTATYKYNLYAVLYDYETGKMLYKSDKVAVDVT